MNVQYFPFDFQVCRLRFASWAYTGHELDVMNVSNEADMGLFVDNGEWNIIRVPVIRKVLRYPCCEEPFPEVTFFFIMRRQVLFYMFNLVMPCMLITTVGLLVFWLPPDSGEKVSLGVTVLLSLVVFLLIVSDKLPATSDTVPMIAFYFACTIILISVSCGIAVLVWNLHNMGNHEIQVPRWLRRIAKMLSGCCCVKYKEADTSLDKLHLTKQPDTPYLHYSLMDGVRKSHDLLSAFDSWSEKRTESPVHHATERSFSNTKRHKEMDNTNQLESILQVLQRLELKSKADETHLNNIDEWKSIALVVDRVCFWIIFLISVLISCILFVNGYFRSINIPEVEY